MKRGLKKNISDKLAKNKLCLNKLEKDCRTQGVFFTIRNNQIDFYHKGGLLFCFDNNGFKTHLKNASVITPNGKDYLTETELSTYKLVSDFETNYLRIKENCKNYSGIEALEISSWNELEDMEENEIDSFVRNLVKTIEEYAHAGFSYLQTQFDEDRNRFNETYIFADILKDIIDDNKQKMPEGINIMSSEVTEQTSNKV